jgi:hypothetical protein
LNSPCSAAASFRPVPAIGAASMRRRGQSCWRLPRDRVLLPAGGLPPPLRRRHGAPIVYWRAVTDRTREWGAAARPSSRRRRRGGAMGVHDQDVPQPFRPLAETSPSRRATGACAQPPPSAPLAALISIPGRRRSRTTLVGSPPCWLLRPADRQPRRRWSFRVQRMEDARPPGES